MKQKKKQVETQVTKPYAKRWLNFWTQHGKRKPKQSHNYLSVFLHFTYLHLLDIHAGIPKQYSLYGFNSFLT